MSKPREPVIEGWFTTGKEPALLGSRCTTCGAIFFPAERFSCRNPRCSGTELHELPLSRRGKLWSYTNNCYPPPPPYVPSDPFEPYAIAAVELEREKMVVLGQVVPGVPVEELELGMEMELVVDVLDEDDEKQLLVWKWRPAAPAAGAGGS